MLTGIHFLLSYICNYECDHCFLYCSPRSNGTFSLEKIEKVLNEAVKIKTIEWIYFEGGEPFLYYPLMLEGIKKAKERGFRVGIVTNSYWATNAKDAELWLKPFAELGISDLSISDDIYHYGKEASNLAKNAKEAALNLGLPMNSICIDEPIIEKDQEKGKPIIGGGAMFRGRAIKTLIKDLPRRSWKEMKECPYEDLIGLRRIHVDPFGNAHICQGLSIGNFWETSLSELIISYDSKAHPICEALIRGGPAELVKKYNITHDDSYIDECHLCYMTRLALLNKFPQYLAPRQVYGLEE